MQAYVEDVEAIKSLSRPHDPSPDSSFSISRAIGMNFTRSTSTRNVLKVRGTVSIHIMNGIVCCHQNSITLPSPNGRRARAFTRPHGCPTISLRINPHQNNKRRQAFFCCQLPQLHVCTALASYTPPYQMPIRSETQLKLNEKKMSASSTPALGRKRPIRANTP